MSCRPIEFWRIFSSIEKEVNIGFYMQFLLLSLTKIVDSKHLESYCMRYAVCACMD